MAYNTSIVTTEEELYSLEMDGNKILLNRIKLKEHKCEKDDMIQELLKENQKLLKENQKLLQENSKYVDINNTLEVKIPSDRRPPSSPKRVVQKPDIQVIPTRKAFLPLPDRCNNRPPHRRGLLDELKPRVL